jgi:hypothetical protein
MTTFWNFQGLFIDETCLILLSYPKNRRDLYADAIRDRAMAILLVQVGSGQTQQLVKRLLNWPLVEIKIFVSELTIMLDPLQCVIKHVFCHIF